MRVLVILISIRHGKQKEPPERTAKWIRIMALAIVAFIVFSYLHSRGISPVWAAVAIVCFKGFFRFLYKIACLLVAAAILFCILSYLVF